MRVRFPKGVGLVALPHPAPANVNGWVRAISGDGRVILCDMLEPFLLHHDGTITPLEGCNAIRLSNDGTIVIGSCFGGHGLEAVRWTKATGWELFGDIEGGQHYARAWAISGDGTTIVGEAIGAVSRDAWRWSKEMGLENLELDAPGVTQSLVESVSHDGSIIAGYSDVHGAMVWDRRNGMRSLQTILEEEHGVTLPGWTLVSVMAMSVDGRAYIGVGENPSGDYEGWRVVLPPLPIEGDVNGDGSVDGADIALVLGNWTGAPG